MNSSTSGEGAAGPPVAGLDHGDLGPNVLAATFTTWSIAFIFVLLRFYTRATIVRTVGLADWFIALSLTAALGMCISKSMEVKNGSGKHVYDFDFMNRFSSIMEAWWFSLLFYVLSLSLTKMSICLLYLTIFTIEWARRACFALIFIVAVTSLWSAATTLTYCIPLQATWDFTVIPTFCQPQDAWWANTGITIVTDLMIFILPIPLVLPLKLPLRQKILVVGIFAIGFFVCIISFIRLAYLIAVKTSSDMDFTYTGTNLTYWTVIEVHTAIVVACTMTLKPLVTRFFPNLMVPSSRRSDTSKDEASAVSSGPPLTIGSKPSRMVVQPEMGGVVIGGVDEVLMGDLEQQRGAAVLGQEEVVEKEEKSVEVVEQQVGVTRAAHHGPWVKSDTASERTEDLGREMTARSIG